MLRGDEARVIVTGDEISPIMKQAIVAVEDRRFWEHRGVDLRGIFRAVWADIRHQEVIQGGSTITQQLVKNTYIKPERTVEPEAEGGGARLAAGAAVVEGADPHRLPEHDLLRQRRVRRRHGRARVLPEDRERADAPRSRTAGRHSRQPDGIRPDRQPDARAGQARHGARAHVRAGPDHEGATRRRAAGTAAEPRSGQAARNPGARAVLRRVCEVPADPVLRVRQGLRRRPQGLYDHRHRPPAARAGGGREVAARPERAAGRAGRHRPARREGAGDDRRVELLEVRVQPGGARRAPARLVLQAVRAGDGALAGHLSPDHVRVEASGALARRQALGGQQLRERVPRDDQPREGDDRLRQHRLRPADRRHRAAERRPHGPPPRHRLTARGLSRDRPGRRGSQPARDGPGVLRVRQRREPCRRLAARERPAGRARGAGRETARPQRAGEAPGARRRTTRRSSTRSCRRS